MRMESARQSVVLIGLAVPHVAYIFRGVGYSLGDFLFLTILGPIYWGSILAISRKYRYPLALVPSVVLGYGYVFWSLAVRDLGYDAQSALVYIWVPIYSLVPIGVGGAIGYVMDRWIGLGPVDSFSE